MLVRASARIAGALGVLGVGARVMGVPAPVAGGRVQGGRGLLAGVTLQGTGSRDVRQEAAGRVVPGRVAAGSPVMLGSLVARGRVATGSPVILGSLVARGRVAPGRPVVMGAGRGSGALGAAQAEAGRQAGPPETGLPGRAKPGSATGPGRTVVPQEGAGRGLGHSGAEMVAGKAAAALESVHLRRGAAAMAAPAVRALRRCPVAGLGPGRGGTLVPGATLAPGATIGTHGGHPAGSV